MAYRSLYRRYRPQRFAEVRGQDHVVLTLRNAVRDSTVSHAYLFSGPRGTGKTSSARILAKALNCENPVDGEPCGVCEACVAITEGRSLDVFELDAASNNGVEAMRELVDRVSLGTPGRWKVYIVDEVHMLSAAAANTLLKTLEEPPGHVVFVLATTEPQKVLPTIRSRTQHFEFRLLPAGLLAEYLQWVATDAGLDVAPEAIELVARRGSGSARDALSVLDQVAAAGSIEPDVPTSDELVEALCERDIGSALVAVAERCGAGHDARQLTRDLLEHLRQVFLATMARALVALPDDDVVRVEGQGRRLGPAATVRAMEVLGEALIAMRDALDPRILLEVALARLCRPELDDSPGALLQRIERLERAAATGTPGDSAPSTSDQPSTPASREEEPAVVTGPTMPAGRTGSPSEGARRALGGATATARTPAPPAPSRAKAGPPPPRRSDRAANPPPTGTAPPPTDTATPAETAPATEPAATGPAPTPPPPTALLPPESPASEEPGSLPTRDELTLAWGDHVLSGLSQPARARFRVGRFMDVSTDAAILALPNSFHRDRCEPYRHEVEAALTGHFGTKVPLRLVVDNEETRAPAKPLQPDEEAVDWSELQPVAPSALASPVDHLKAAFEGAEVVEE